MKEIKIKEQVSKKRITLWNFGNPIKVSVKKYLNNVDYTILNRICLEEFFKYRENDNTLNLDRYDYFGNVKIIFDTYILQNLCEFKDVELSDENIQKILSSKMFYKIIKNIKNYVEFWNLIIKSLELKNIFVSLNLLRDILPNTNALEENTKTIVGIINELNERNPQLLQKMVQMNLVDSQLSQAIKKAKEEKNKNKNDIQ